jgi:hypothetical protein
MNKKLSFTVSNHTTHGVKPHRVIFYAIVALPEENKYGGVAYEENHFWYEPDSIMFSFDDNSDECKFSLFFPNAST